MDEIEELASVICGKSWKNLPPTLRDEYRRIARDVFNAGYRKSAQGQGMDEEKALDFAEAYLGEARNDAWAITLYNYTKAIIKAHSEGRLK